MSKTYLHGHGTRQTPQNQPIPGSSQVANSAGGFSFEVDKWTRLDRFLVLGSSAGTYYIGEADLTAENVAVVRECLAEDYIRTVQAIVDVSTAGRNIKQEPVIFALALAASTSDPMCRQFALAKLNDVCRTGTHLFMFASYVQEHRGWGRALRRAVANWYAQDPAKVAYQATKYRDRHGFTHADLLRLGHPARSVSAGNPTVELSPYHDALFAWIKDRNVLTQAAWQEAEGSGALAVIADFERAQAAATPAETAALIRGSDGRLSREMLKTEHLTDPDVNRALLDAGMPMTALIRNLANLTRYGVLEGDYVKRVCEKITNTEAIRKARVHPMTVLFAMKTYEAGRGLRSMNTWVPVAAVVDALDEAFYAAFENVEPTGKRHLIALDVSGSMFNSYVGGTPLDAATCAAAMAMVTLRAGDPCEVVAFTGTRGYTYGRSRASSPPPQIMDGLSSMSLSPRQRLDDVVKKIEQEYAPYMAGTDCALPLVYATEKNREYDVVATYTDSETWAGNIHPMQALQRYREQSGISARMVTVGMTSNGFTIGDPADAGTMDVVGFDPAAPAAIAEFVKA